MKYSPRADELYRRSIQEIDAKIYYFDQISKNPVIQEILAEQKGVQRDYIFLTFGLMYYDLQDADWPESLKAIYESLPDQRQVCSVREDHMVTALHVASQLLRRNLPFTMLEYSWLVDRCIHVQEVYDWRNPHLSALVNHIKRYADKSEEPLDELLKRSLTEFLNALETLFGEHDNSNHVKTLRGLVADKNKFPLRPGEAWSDRALADGREMPDPLRQAWAALILHCQSASAGKPSKKWLKTAQTILDEIGQEAFTESLLVWFPLVDHQGSVSDRTFRGISGLHQDTLKGLCWCCSLVDDARLARAVAALAVMAYKKVPGSGPHAIKVGNACVWALGQISNETALGQLAYLKVKIKFGTAQKGIEKALNETAERMQVPREEIEEMGVPAYGLTAVGQLEETLGDFTAQLNITGTTTTELLWLKADGKPQKSVPAAVKKEFPEELKELKASAKDIQKMLPAQRERIDNLFLEQKQWSFETWKERYLDHPLVGTLARRIIWRFKTGAEVVAGIWQENQLVDQDSQPLSNLNESTTVELWHPIEVPTEQVLAWREWLEQHEVQQPFKQAHREVYLLTDAERNTRVYSNRYAAHIIRQHQFNALCGARRWKNQLRLMVDGDYPPAMKLLPKWDLRVEFWVEGIGDNYGTDTNETGTYLYLATDQVRFYPLTAAQRTAYAAGGGYITRGEEGSDTPIALAEIPPLVLSELLRDVDLFVGVASVANDPSWSDGGPDGRYVDYWQSYSFGDLSATANTRREILQRLIPRLKIAKKCSFEEKFLVVQGELRTYKIHLGSSNILMSPDDAYLCIVPNQSLAGKSTNSLFLPFEGDNMLSIILSKAFLLADDKKITDSSIVSQITQGL
ncbi:DUF4132 domain-containing protein [uncultured Gimesia sp.]|uniref:DUF4132 domain-containing protein n=1 Tax=uncultured Gimesia sp. TaxID=1678688 RepID=UPI0026025660|nr:DUF4132 domain-containing protein [uncultured Gimesia sp.]